MRERFRGNNLTEQEIRELVGTMLHANDGLYAGVRIRCVAVMGEGGWQSGLLVAQAVPRTAEPEHTQSLRYSHARLLDEWGDVSVLIRLLDEISSGHVIVDGDSIALRVNPGFGEYEFQPGLNEYSDFPGCVLQSGRMERVPISRDPLLAYGLPFYSDGYAAMRDWLPISRFHGMSDARISTAIVVLPECRARFSGFEWADGVLVGSVVGEARVLERLRAKGSFEADGIRQNFGLPVDDNKVRIAMSASPDTFEIYLVGPDDTVYDFRHETPHWVVSRERILGTPLSEIGDEADVLAALAQGEGDEIEFKPFVKRGDSKLDEIVETVIAFGNTRGGVIFLGVNDHCVPVGIERELEKMRRAGGHSAEEILREYVGWLKQSIGGVLNKSLPLTIRSFVLDGHTLIAIHVPEGDQKAYCHRDRKIVYVRRGASNLVADPDRDLPELLRSTEPQFGSPWRSK